MKKSLRDEIAIEVLKSLVLKRGFDKATGVDDIRYLEMARGAYAYADALLSVRAEDE